METIEEIVNGEIYTITTLASGHIIRELKMTEAQKSVMSNTKRRIMTRLEFKRQFSMQELVAFKTGIKTDVTMEVFDDLLNSTAEVNLDDPLISQGLSYLVALKIITQEKMDQIMCPDLYLT